MKKITILTALMLVSATLYAQDQMPPISQRPNIEVTGEAETRVEPNIIEIIVNLSQEQSKGKISMTELDRAFAAALEQAGVDIKTQVVITDQSSYSSNRREIYQYKGYKVTLDSAAQASNLFQCLVSNGIASSRLGRVQHTDMDQIINNTKIAAIKEAKTIAQTLTEAIGQKIGKAIVIEESNSNVIMLRGTGPASKSIAAEFEESPLAKVKIGDISVKRKVTVQFELLK